MTRSPETCGVLDWPVLQLGRQTMKRSRFIEEQIIGILREHQAGLSAKGLCRKYGF